MIDDRLRALRVVQERGTIAAAAASMGYTPSALSHQLRTLARDVGTALLEPVGRGVQLTPAAEVLLKRTTTLVEQWERVRADVLQHSGEGTGHLWLAGFSTAASALLPAVVAAVTRQFPHSHVKIIEADPEVCFELLLAERVDLAVVVATDPLPPSSDPRYEQLPLMTDDLELVVPVDHPLAARDEVALADAATEDWILDRPGRPYHRLAASACLSAGFTPTVAHEVVEWDTCAALVAAGLGVSLVPQLAWLPGRTDIKRLTLTGDDAPVRHVRTAVRRGTAGQPEIALALRELQRVADEIVAGRTAQA